MLLWSVIGTKFSLASWCVDSLGDDTRSISLLNIDSSWVSVSRFPLQFAIMFLKLSISSADVGVKSVEIMDIISFYTLCRIANLSSTLWEIADLVSYTYYINKIKTKLLYQVSVRVLRLIRRQSQYF